MIQNTTGRVALSMPDTTKLSSNQRHDHGVEQHAEIVLGLGMAHTCWLNACDSAALLRCKHLSACLYVLSWWTAAGSQQGALLALPPLLAAARGRTAAAAPASPGCAGCCHRDYPSRNRHPRHYSCLPRPACSSSWLQEGVTASLTQQQEVIAAG